MVVRKKSWTEKMKPEMEPKVEITEKPFADIPAGAKMLIATPTIIEEYIRNIPVGVHTSLQQMRKDLAAEYHADYTCPVTSGIFLRIVSEKAYEDYEKGTPVKKIAPF